MIPFVAHPDRPLQSARRLLLVEDEHVFAKAAAKRLGREGYVCQIVSDLVSARAACASDPPDLILLDLRLPDGNGLDFLAELNQAERIPAVMVLTAFGEISDAVQAMKQGAADYLKKPIDLDELVLSVHKVARSTLIQNALEYSREREAHQSAVLPDGAPYQLLGDSVPMRALREQIRTLALVGAGSREPAPTVLILGETGTGKDVAARLLHASGPRKQRPFLHIDCASLPPDLIEAELFGHEKGAYTNAQGARAGLIEAAEDGTVFLDEIGEIASPLQAKLLAVLERRVLRRIGSVRERPIAASFIGATNRDLAELVSQGRFRSDLYYRLNVLSLTMPPLRARGDDVLLLARNFAAQTARRYDLPPAVMGPDAMEAIRGYSWPGNVRELKHQVQRAALLHGGGTISSTALGLPPNATTASVPNLLGLTLDEAERMLITETLRTCAGNVSEAARRLAVTRMTLRYRMEKYGLKPSSAG